MCNRDVVVNRSTANVYCAQQRHDGRQIGYPQRNNMAPLSTPSFVAGELPMIRTDQEQQTEMTSSTFLDTLIRVLSQLRSRADASSKKSVFPVPNKWLCDSIQGIGGARAIDAEPRSWFKYQILNTRYIHMNLPLRAHRTVIVTRYTSVS